MCSWEKDETILHQVEHLINWKYNLQRLSHFKNNELCGSEPDGRMLHSANVLQIFAAGMRV